MKLLKPSGWSLKTRRAESSQSGGRRLRMETLEDRRLLAIDLAPAVFSGWDDSLVISTQSGTNTDDAPITVADTVFVDIGWANFGTTTVLANTFTTRLSLDGGTVVNVGTPFDLDQFSGATFQDVNLGQLSLGSHTLTLSVDVDNDVIESSESNNIRQRVINVVAVGTEDFGDAPTAAQSGFAANYPTTLADDGARHTPLAGFSLGVEIDTESDGQPSVTANLDDTSGSADDEDGVTFGGTLATGTAGSVDVFVTNTAGVSNPYLDAWIDFNRDGDWTDSGELIFSGAATAGTNTLNFSVPVGASSGQTFARFRLHDGLTGLATTGLATDGEVEDHQVAIAQSGFWIDQGPAPTQNAQLEPNTSPDQQVTGAIHTVLAHPTDVDTLYIGAVNGGIWKTTNATNTNPDWTPQTDFLSSLSIGAMAFDYTDVTFNTIVAGTAKYSSFAGFGGARGPIYRTTDGGSTWTELSSSGLKTVGENVSGIAARGSTIVVTSSGNFGGLFRSTDGGASFLPIDDADFESPNDNFTDLVLDPSDPSGLRLYAAAESTGGTGTTGGVYRSDDFGASWTKITGPTIDSDMHDLLASSNNIEMAVHPTTGRLYVAVLVSGQPRGIFHTNGGTTSTPTWTEMDVPVLPLGGGNALTGATNASPIEITSVAHGLSTGNYVVVNGVTGNTAANGFYQVTVTGTDTFTLSGSIGNGTYSGGGTWTHVTGPNPKAKDIEETGAQGRIHFSITVDPSDEDIVYVGGDRQDSPNLIGDSTFGGAIFRGDASIARDPSLAPSPQWDHLTHDIVALDPSGGTANGTAPHADSREMTFDAAGNLIEVDDGGVFRRTSPGDNTGDWFTLAGTLGVIEFHDVAYDSNTSTILGGTQDNGTHFQVTTGDKVWDFLSGGDGGDVGVDNVTLAGSNQSIRYSSFQNLSSFRKTTWDASNNLLSTSFPSLTVSSGSALVPQFKTPVELNAVDPQRMLIVGANGIYESTNQGDTIAQIGGAHSIGFLQDAVDYGGYQGGVPNTDVFYVGVGDDIRVRTSAGGSISTIDPDLGSSGNIRDVVMDSDDWSTAFAIDDNQVFHTTNSGSAWTDVTGNLMSLAGEALQTIEYIPGPIGALVIGGNLGVFTALVDSLESWAEVGTNLPNALVYDLKYNSDHDVLVAGTLGRGAWTLPNAGAQLGGDFAPTVAISRDGENPTIASTQIFSVDFSEEVINVDATDFELDLTGSVTANAVVTVDDAGDLDDSTYAVTVDTVSGVGTLGLNIAVASDITDLASNAVVSTPTLDEVYTIPIPGDLNGDSRVDAADFGIVASNWQLLGLGYSDGNISGDNIVDASDAGIMFANWTGDPGPVGSPSVQAQSNAAATTLPEASQAVLALASVERRSPASFEGKDEYFSRASDSEELVRLVAERTSRSAFSAASIGVARVEEGQSNADASAAEEAIHSLSEDSWSEITELQLQPFERLV